MECAIAGSVLFAVGFAYLLFMVGERDKLDSLEKQQRDALAERLAALEAEYKQSLSDLAGDPSNTQLRIRVLEIGRQRSALSRELGGQAGTSVFDEVALQNDLLAHGGGN